MLAKFIVHLIQGVSSHTAPVYPNPTAVGMYISFQPLPREWSMESELLSASAWCILTGGIKSSQDPISTSIHPTAVQQPWKPLFFLMCPAFFSSLSWWWEKHLRKQLEMHFVWSKLEFNGGIQLRTGRQTVCGYVVIWLNLITALLTQRLRATNVLTVSIHQLPAIWRHLPNSAPYAPHLLFLKTPEAEFDFSPLYFPDVSDSEKKDGDLGHPLWASEKTQIRTCYYNSWI